MNREETKAAIEVMRAWADGAEIEYRRKTDSVWHPGRVAKLCNWDFFNIEYRIKPEPREGWVRVSNIHSHKN